MQEQTENRLTIGAIIDKVIESLTPLDEKARQTAIKTVCEHLDIQLSQMQQEKPTVGSRETILEAPRPHTPTIIDIRSFAKEKAPATAIERVLLVAYWLKELAPEGEKKDTIDKNDLTTYFKQAGFPLPPRPDQALVNARHAGYLESCGGGKYKINAVGYNLIAYNLPRSGEESRSNKARRPQKRRKSTHKRPAKN